MSSKNSADDRSRLLELAYLYAIDAVDDIERAAIERDRAQTDPATRQAFDEIVRDVRETMARTSAGSAVAPPAHLRNSILSSVGVAEPVVTKPRKRWSRRLVMGVAAALAILVGGGVAIDLYTRAPGNDTIVSAVELAADRRDITTELSTGGTMTVTYSLTLGQAFVLLKGVANVPDDRTYQLWIIKDGAHPAGLPVPGKPAPMTGLTSGSAVAITIESAGGAAQPTMTPLAVANL
jgi:hypothetical protein